MAPILRVTAALALLAAIVYALVATGVHLAFAYKDQLVANSFVVHAPHTEHRTFDAAGAQAVAVEIVEGFGELDVHGGATNLLRGEFTYNVDELRPEIHYAVEDGQGKLTIQHPNVTAVYRMFNLTQYRNRWSLGFADDIPLNLSIVLGVGEARLNLAGLLLTGGEIGLGAGNLTLDLSGPWRRSFALAVNGGVGERTLVLPASTGVRVVVESGLSGGQARGLTQTGEEGDEYTNAAYGHTDATIEIVVEGGLGAINLLVEE